MVANNLSGDFAYDVSSLNKLKYDAGKHSPKATREVARQFEAMFLKQLLDTMQKTVPKSGLFGDTNADKQYQDMMNAQWAQTLAQRGVGMSPMLVHAMERDGGAAASASTSVKSGDDVTGGASSIPATRPRALSPSESLASIRAQRDAVEAQRREAAKKPMENGAPLVQMQSGAVQPLLSLGPSDSVGATPSGALSQKAQQFVDQMRAPAHTAALETGMPARLLVAQAALETGWGAHEIRTQNGGLSHNVFNIKATHWHGPAQKVETHEYVNGQREPSKAGFRVYDSYHAAFADYARLINDNPRYAAARSAQTPEAAAQALQDAGYATDPAYASKLVAVMDTLPGASAGGLFASGGQALVDLDAGHAKPLIS